MPKVSLLQNAKSTICAYYMSSFHIALSRNERSFTERYMKTGHILGYCGFVLAKYVEIKSFKQINTLL